MVDSGNSERLEAELALLQSMYPEEVSFSPKSQELTYTTTSEHPASLTIRLPAGYPEKELPDLIQAHTDTVSKTKLDLRTDVRKILKSLTPGEESIDTLITSFNDLVATSSSIASTAAGVGATSNHASLGGDPQRNESLTVIIWLHHLLATSKRKQALAHGLHGINGLSKPGYPGVMIFSGRADVVGEHVAGLKGLKWQAFQIRLERKELWHFLHGEGVREVETMGDVVQVVGDERREAFLEAMKIK